MSLTGEYGCRTGSQEPVGKKYVSSAAVQTILSVTPVSALSRRDRASKRAETVEFRVKPLRASFSGSAKCKRLTFRLTCLIVSSVNFGSQAGR